MFFQTGRTRCLHIHINGDPALSVVIREGDQSFCTGGFSDSSKSDIWSIPGSDIPIEKWNELEPIDLLILCTQSDFKFHFNGKLIKSVSSSFWHNPSDGSYPTITQIDWRAKHNAKFTKLAWTYGKL